MRWMKPRDLAACAMVAMLAACAGGQGGGKPEPARVATTTLPTPDMSAVDQPLAAEVTRLVNAARAERGRDPLGYAADLARVAAIHSADMVARGFTGHYNPDGQGAKERVVAVRGERAGSVGENIAVVTREEGESRESVAARVVQQWQESPRHRQLMMASYFDQTGVGVAISGNEIYVTELFAGE